MPSPRLLVLTALSLATLCLATSPARAEEPVQKPATGAADAAGVPDFEAKIAPILKKYCTSCHNPEDADGGLSLESYTAILKGGAHGAALLPSQSKSSRLVRVLTGEAKPKMPPKDQPAPTAAEIELLKVWIDGGAKGPSGVEPERTKAITPKIKPAKVSKAVTAVAWSPKEDVLAIARFGEVELQSHAGQTLRKVTDVAGKVNSVEFSSDGALLIVASGYEGVVGQAALFNVADGALVKKLSGHRDTIYSATLSPDRKLLATGSYDRQILLWDVASGTVVRTLKGHNDAIYDLAFSPDGTILASASGDQTIKLWQVATGVRLDTLSQPLKEQYTVAFSPDGQFVVGGGVDNRIRVWRVISKEKPQINPILFSRFAHEGPIVQLGFTPDGQYLASVGDDKSIKLWHTSDYAPAFIYDPQPDSTPALAVAPSGQALLVGRMNGSTQIYPIAVPPRTPAATAAAPMAIPTPSVAAGPMNTLTETEPNDSLAAANAVTLPVTVSAVIQAAAGQKSDSDLYKFQAQAGQNWVLEINAARNKSPLDSRLEILDAQGKKVLRVRLQAVRDSYVTFRGIDSNTRDCRLHNWEEMRLNELVYINGEIVKLFLAPRGPDSGFGFYPHDGSRRTLFDTTPTSHAMGEPCYIVEPLAPNAAPIANGLPVFPLYFENDDDGLRKFGSDSRLNFTAPATGEYFVRVTDVRGFQGDNFKYELQVRPAKPDFTVALTGVNPTINIGSGKEFAVAVDRIDGFDGEIRVDIAHLPPGFGATNPLIIQAGQGIARGTLNTLPDAPAVTAEAAKAITLTATATIDGQVVTKPVNNFGEIKLADKPKLLVTLLPTGVANAPPVGKSADGPSALPQPMTIDIAPGETITAVVRVERNGYEGRVRFEAINQNLPHGVIIDNIGLSGLMIVEGQTERTFFLTAADWVPETERPFHLQSQDEGNQTSWPVILRVRKPADVKK